MLQAQWVWKSWREKWFAHIGILLKKLVSVTRMDRFLLPFVSSFFKAPSAIIMVCNYQECMWSF